MPTNVTRKSRIAIDGTLFIGRLGDGGIVRTNSRTGEVVVFVAPGESESRSISGVFADDAANTLWACSNDLSALGGPSSGGDSGSALIGFDLAKGATKRSVPLPGPHAFCNDIAVDSSGAAYVTESAGPRTERLGEVARLLIDHAGATGSVFLWETQLLAASQGKGA